MAKTKWIVDKDQITLYPNRNLNLFGIVMLVIFIALGFFMRQDLQVNNSARIIYIVFFILVNGSFFINAAQKIVFDRIEQMMFVRVLGNVTLKAVHFSNIAAIQPVFEYGNIYNFQVFKNSNRHGKGIRISIAYSKETDENAIALTTEVFPLIESFLAEAPGNAVLEQAPITSYDFYNVDQHVYRLKPRMGILVIGGLISTIWGIYAFLMVDLSTVQSPVMITWLPLVFGLFLLFASTNRVQFDTREQLIRSTLIGGIRKREYPFDAFNGFSIVRKTTNFIYSGTEVSMKLESPKPGKIDGLLLQSFARTKKIEQLLKETESILAKKS